MAVSESDLGGFATTYEDALAETEGYSSYDSPSDSYPVNQNYKQRNLSRYQNAVPFGGYASNYQAPRGFATEQDMREGATHTQDVMGLLQRMGFIKAVPGSGEVGQEQVDPSFAINYGNDVTQDMTKVGGGNSFVPQSGWDINAASPANPTNNPFDLNLQFNQDPAAKAFRDNISGILNPTGEQIAAMHDKAAQGEQTANWARDKFFGAMPFDDPKPKIEAWRKGVRSDIGDAFKTGLGAVGDVIGDGWDNMTEAQVNKADPVPTENFEALAMPTARNTDYDAINQARYSAFNKAGTLGNTGPVGPDGTNFSPNRWSPYEQMANTQASATSGADNIARILNTNIQLDPSKMTANLNNKTMTDALTYKDRQAMSKKQIVELINNRGNTSTIHAVGYEEYDRDPLVPSSYSPIYSPEDENLINLFRMKGFDAEDFRIYPQQQQNIKGGGQTSIGLPSSFKPEPLGTVTPFVDVLTLGGGLVGGTVLKQAGAALSNMFAKNGETIASATAKYGKEFVDGLINATKSLYRDTKPSSSMAKSDLHTLQELGKMPAYSKSTHLGGPGKPLTGEGKITRNIDRDLFGVEKKLSDDILKFKGTNKQRLLQRNKDLRGINKTGSTKDVGAKQSMDKGYVNSRVKGKGQLKQPDTPQGRIAQSNKAQADARAAQKVAMDKKRADIAAAAEAKAVQTPTRQSFGDKIANNIKVSMREEGMSFEQAINYAKAVASGSGGNLTTKQATEFLTKKGIRPPNIVTKKF